jgi:orotidine-5'-phosphate decarboxylase
MKEKVKKMSKNISARDRLILALDPDLEKMKEMEKEELKKEVTSILDELEGRIGLVKVNYLAKPGNLPEIVEMIQERGIDVWRDWKHKDIPRTVEGFIIADVKEKIAMTTVHADGGIEMMKYAVKGTEGSDLKILGITVLTSIDQKTLNEELEILGELIDKVLRYALNAEEAGLDGVVASAKEAQILREKLKPETLIVTPGIKPEWAAKAVDQKRVVTPYKAILNGSDYLVVGSAIIKSEKWKKTRSEAAEAIVAEIDKALSERNF